MNAEQIRNFETWQACAVTPMYRCAQCGCVMRASRSGARCGGVDCLLGVNHENIPPVMLVRPPDVAHLTESAETHQQGADDRNIGESIRLATAVPPEPPEYVASLQERVNELTDSLGNMAERITSPANREDERRKSDLMRVQRLEDEYVPATFFDNYRDAVDALRREDLVRVDRLSVTVQKLSGMEHIEAHERVSDYLDTVEQPASTPPDETRDIHIHTADCARRQAQEELAQALTDCHRMSAEKAETVNALGGLVARIESDSYTGLQLGDAMTEARRVLKEDV